jgi:quercetin dioxygenase-like cupin family protein
MTNFYDKWLSEGAQISEKFRRSPVIAHGGEIPWVRTRQDAKVKLMVANDLGFPTMGGVVLKAEIPVGWHTGKRAAGEESIHFLCGSGFSMIDGRRYNWHAGSTMQIPYRATHQHFNTGTEPVQYISASCLPLELFVNLGRIEQLEDCGPNDPGILASFPAEESQYLKNGHRVVIHLEDAPQYPGEQPADTPVAVQNQHVSGKYLVVGRNGFKDPSSVAIAHIFEEPAGYHGGKHRHLEAVLYVLDGEGFTEIEGVSHRWEAGDVMHVPPAMFEHLHFNDSNKSYRLLRIQFGIRIWFTNIWPEGYLPQRVYDDSGRPIIAGKIAS